VPASSPQGAHDLNPCADAEARAQAQHDVGRAAEVDDPGAACALVRAGLRRAGPSHAGVGIDGRRRSSECDDGLARSKAMEEAVADARKSAEAMAKAAAKSFGAAKSVPIAPGQLDITANVVVVFELT
jgi:hypothetical protein